MSDTLTSHALSEQAQRDQSALLIKLLKGPVYRARHRDLWEQLLRDQQSIRDYFQHLGLGLTLDEAEGYAFMAQLQFENDDAELPRLISRRSLTLAQTLLLVALRKRLAEHDDQESAPRLIVSRQEIYQWLQPYSPEVSNELKQQREYDALIKKVIEMGFLSSITNHPNDFEVQRIIKAFVNAEQIAEFSQLLTPQQEQKDD
ncbi:DUF4194 domain-containing protein [Oceanisphaera pacifica]|uniref:DUF4194 domain-containing protein n=1 Tax=Oceanisphaera pacifica TaxID=2818389 RepID=A0ABS3NGC6_9GAMM|nr:DUF4194 domain-containing protein [Oceanisphaera pacifica]MBO1519641.1 DUF4194 domain-containing protein [Oceanisphaera pacifica]